MHTSSLILALFAFGTAVFLLPTKAKAEQLYTSNGSGIARFDSAALGTVTTVPFTGLQAGEVMIGIDIRPFNGAIYGIGSTSRIYTINPLTGASTQVGSTGAFTLNGTVFGMDFNPVADRIRLVSNTEQSLRLSPVDGTLSGTDTPLSPAGNVVSVAYDRNDLDTATPTTLYGIDSVAGTLVLIGSANGNPNSPNTGLVTTVGSLGLGVNLNDSIGFDISGVSGIGFATITTGGISRLYNINLTTGSATLMGPIGSGTAPYMSIAAIPEPGTATMALSCAAFALTRRLRRSAV